MIDEIQIFGVYAPAALVWATLAAFWLMWCGHFSSVSRCIA